MNEYMNDSENAEVAVSPEAAADFFNSSLADTGYNEDAAPGERRAMPPEGQYRFRFEFAPLKDGAERWPGQTDPSQLKTTKKGKAFTGTSIKAEMIGVTDKSPITMEEFDALRLAGRKFSSYISSITDDAGRSSLTDFIKCCIGAWPKTSSLSQTCQAVEELMQQLPEGIATIKWEPYYMDDERKFQRLGDLDAKYKKQYGRGAGTFPRETDPDSPNFGHPKQSWELKLNEEETLTVIALPQLDVFLPRPKDE